jgi:hypothetical protein
VLSIRLDPQAALLLLVSADPRDLFHRERTEVVMTFSMREINPWLQPRAFASWRRLHAIATYLSLRPGAIYALEWGRCGF